MLDILVYFGYRERRGCAVKAFRYGVFPVAVLLACLLIFSYADEIGEAVISNAKIIYNGNEVNLGIKPVAIDGHHYLPVRASADLFSKDIEWNQKEYKVIIRDRLDPAVEGLKTELANKKKEVTELQEKLRALENDIEKGKKPSLEELQDRLNDEYGEFEGVVYRVILSGNEAEARVKVEVDLEEDRSAWNRLTTKKKKEMLEEFCPVISGEYPDIRIKGYVKDISNSNRLFTFYNKYNGEIEIGSYRNYSTIGTLEDRLNDDYSDYFNDIHISFQLSGNENRIDYHAVIQLDKFQEEWEGLSDNTIKYFMKKMCSEIKTEFGTGCVIYGHFYDLEGRTELAYCSQLPDSDFEFSRESVFTD